MQKWIKIISIGALFVGSWLPPTMTVASAASSVQEKPIKLGVVNVALLLEKAPQAQAASKKLEQEFSPQQQTLQKMAKELNQKQAQYAKNKLVMSEAQKQAKERELALLSREVQRKQNDIQEMLNLRRNEELAQIQKLVNQAIKAIGAQEQYDLILYEGIAYTNNRLDVTPKVLAYLEKLNKQQKSDFNK